MTFAEARIHDLVEDFSISLRKVRRDPQPDQIHKLRVSTRRFTAALEYGDLKPGKKQQAYLENLEDLRKKAGKVRDLDIQLELVNELPAPADHDDLRSLGAHLEKKRKRRASKLGELAGKLRHTRLLAHMEQMGQSAVSADRPEHDGALSEAQARLNVLAQKNQKHSTFKAGRLHQLRIELKMVRYLAELAPESAEKEHLMRQLKSAQDALGKWHDWESLTITAKKFFADKKICAVLQEIRTLAESRRMEAVTAVSEFFSGLNPSKKLPQRARVQRSLAINA